MENNQLQFSLHQVQHKRMEKDTDCARLDKGRSIFERFKDELKEKTVSFKTLMKITSSGTPME